MDEGHAAQTAPIIAKLRAVRDQHAARFDYDVEAICRDIWTRQKASGREYVRYPARRASFQSDTLKQN